jgi:sporulation protein YlmC with PRC-barrel domain
MKTIVILALSSLVLAGTAGVHAAEPPEQKGEAPKSAGPSATRTDALSADMEATLRKAGFTDLRIMPNSILVRAKDKTGQAVAMVLNPGTMTEMVTLDPHSGSSAGGDGAHRPLTGSGTFTTVLATERLASTLIGLVVHDASGAELATVKDIAIDHDGLQAYILALGGMLGIGDRYVAVTPSAITIAYDQVANRYAATMAATTDQLKAAPAFTYDGAFKAGRN